MPTKRNLIPKREEKSIDYGAQQFIISSPYSKEEDFNPDRTVKYVRFSRTRRTRVGTFRAMYERENTTFDDPEEPPRKRTVVEYTPPTPSPIADQPLALVVAPPSPCAAPVVEDSVPAVEDIVPFLDDPEHIVEDSVPAVEDLVPVVDGPVVDEPAPAIMEVDAAPKPRITFVCKSRQNDAAAKTVSVTTACELVSPSGDKPVSRRLMLTLKCAKRKTDFATAEYVRLYDHIPNAFHKGRGWRTTGFEFPITIMQ